MKKYSEIFAENLHRLRRQMKMTQEQLADKICYTEKAVSKWESGETKPLKKLHEKLAQVLGCTVEELRGED